MNSKKPFIIIGIIFLSICFTGCGKKPVDNTEAYGNIIAGLGDAEAYAFLVMDTDNHVLVTSDSVYDTGTEKQASISCNVYYFFSGKTENLGSIAGGGTAYPLTFSESAIYTASNHSVERYTVSDKDGLLHLECGIYENFDETGNASYTSIKGEEETVSTEAEYVSLINEYAESQMIHFSYGASGCMNEIMKK